MDSIAADLGIPAFAVGGRVGYSTANNYKDVIDDFAHIGGSYGPIGVEISGSISDGKIKNVTLIGQYSPLSASVLAGEGHVGYGGTEPLWEGTREEFFEMLGKEKIKGVSEIIGQGMKKAWDWYADLWENYQGGHS